MRGEPWGSRQKQDGQKSRATTTVQRPTSMNRQSENRAPRVKNRAPAAVQITAEQLLREAQERQETSFKAPRQRVEDFEELHEYRGRKRKEFEERIRRTRGSVKEWQSYASWEASQGEYDRSRSVYERALDVDARDVKLWLSYTEMVSLFRLYV